MSNCPACGAPLSLRPDTEGFECSYCHKTFFPDAEEDRVEVSGEPSDPSLNCPVCFLPLVKGSLAKSTVLCCVQCRGLLMATGLFSDVVDELHSTLDHAAVQTPADHDDLKRVIQCPQCNRRMDTHSYAGPGNVVVDTCDNCEFIWLDRGEITRIARAPDEGDVERTYGF
jgi:Zn-finger nucleic acid-binding protein